MSTYKWLLDAGHGGIDRNGRYTTAPAKMFTFKDGLVFYEGKNNREIVDILDLKLKEAGIRSALIHDEVRDTPLRERVARANQLYAKDKSCIYLSVHSNAMPTGFAGKGSGYMIYTSKGQTRSDKVADVFDTVYKKQFGACIREERGDGDADFEENFYVLAKTDCPAILTENLFYDNRRQAEYLMSVEGQVAIAGLLFDCIRETEKRKPI